MKRELIDSNIEWLGRIPANWTVQPLKRVLNERNELNKSEKETFLLSLTIQDGIIPYSEKTGGGNKAKEDISKYKIVKKNDIVINSMNVVVGASGISKYDGLVSPVYYIFFETNKSCARFYNYMFLTQTFEDHLFGLGNGILVKINEDNGKMNTIRKKIPIDKLKNEFVPVPSLEEQIKISNYLDDKVSLIDETIENNKKEIELLEEYKYSSINKKLNNCDWKNVRIKNTSYLKGRIGWQGLTTNDYKDEGAYLITGTDFENGKIKWDTCVHISEERYEEDKNIHIKEGDLLITKDGTIGKLAIVDKLLYKTTLNSGVMLIRANNNTLPYDNKYLYYVLKSNLFWNWYESNQKGNATIKHLYQEQFYNFQYPLPAINIQKQIVNDLDKMTSKIDKVIEYRMQIIEKLEEYKKSLIYEAVTGKMEV